MALISTAYIDYLLGGEMTEEQAIKGKEIIDQIQQLQKQLSDIEVYATHIEEQIKQDGIELSISRSWSVVHKARVNGNNFLQFLNSEKCRIKLLIRSLKEELNNI